MAINPDILQWLNTLPNHNGNYHISTPRRFAHEEDDYDAQYHNEPLIFDVGQGALQLFRDYGGDCAGTAVEIGCGTGLMSLGLAAKNTLPSLLLTDPSPKFLDIARKKLLHAGISLDNILFGVLMGEDVSRLPLGAFSLILLRSVLHHIIDVDAFIRDAAKSMKPGGLMIMEEPCQEGEVVMASIAQFFPLVMERAGRPLSSSHSRKLQLFLDTMKFYCRRDIDKSAAEDKHVFRVDEMMKLGRRWDLDLEFFPNRTFYDWAPTAARRPPGDSFTRFFRDYLQFAMAFDEEFISLFDKHLAPFGQWVEELALKGTGPYMHGVFLWKKR